MTEEDESIRNWPEEIDMPEPNPNPNPAPAAAPTETPPAAPAPAAAPTDEFEGMTPEELKAALKNTRSEAAERRREAADLKGRLSTLETEAAKRKEAELEEQGKHKELAEQRGQELEAERKRNNERLINLQLRQIAKDAGLVDLDLVTNIDKSKITIDADGNAVGATEAVEAYKKAKPVLFKKPEAPVTDSGTAPPAPGAAAAAPGGEVDVRKMTKEQYKEYKAAQRPKWRQELGGTGRVTTAA